MATIKTFNITQVGLDSVNFTHSANNYTYTKTDGSDFKRTKERRTENLSWKFSTIGGDSSSIGGDPQTSTCSYARGGSGNDTYLLTAVLTTNYTITKHDWKLVKTSYKTFETDQGQSYSDFTKTSKTEYEFMEKDESGYAYEVREYSWATKSKDEGIQTSTGQINFYPHPAKFTFNNCIPGEPWKIEDGINSLITNITDFQGQAQQRKNWKYQSSQAKCPSFFNDDNIMTRNQMNAVYRYVKETSGNVEEFEKEDKNRNPIYHPISAKMFNDLADIINEKT